MSPADLIVKLLSDGGVLGAIVGIAIIIALPGWAAWWWERRKHGETTQQLIDIATASIEKDVKLEAAIQTNTEVMRQFLNKV